MLQERVKILLIEVMWLPKIGPSNHHILMFSKVMLKMNLYQIFADASISWWTKEEILTSGTSYERYLAKFEECNEVIACIVACNGHWQEGLLAGTTGLDRVVGTRICNFLNLNITSFTRSDPNEDPQEFIDNIRHTLHIMHVSYKKALELPAN